MASATDPRSSAWPPPATPTRGPRALANEGAMRQPDADVPTVPEVNRRRSSRFSTLPVAVRGQRDPGR